MLGGLLIAAVALLIILLLAAAYLRLKTERSYLGLVGKLISAAEPGEEPTGEETVWREVSGEVPAPVENYLDRALPAEGGAAGSIFLEQSGELRIGGERDSDWKRFTADQVVTTDPPGFVWRAQVRMAPFVSADVVDAYVKGKGRLRARLLGVLPVADAPEGPELDSAELARYLAEAVWYPSALRPGEDLEWEEVDDDSARARLRDGENEATLTFHFREDGLVEQVSGRRYREVDGEYVETEWTGRFRSYEEQDGFLIPMEGEVSWSLPEGELAYWRGRVEEVEYGR